MFCQKFRQNFNYFHRGSLPSSDIPLFAEFGGSLDEDKAYGQQSFRESSLLQGTFDLLLGISSKQSLLYGLEYEIKFIFEVQENEKSENVSIFLKVRILLFLYLVQYYLYIQYRKACSQCVFPGFLVCCMILNMDNVERQYLSNRVPYFQEH